MGPLKPDSAVGFLSSIQPVGSTAKTDIRLTYYDESSTVKTANGEIKRAIVLRHFEKLIEKLIDQIEGTILWPTRVGKGAEVFLIPTCLDGSADTTTPEVPGKIDDGLSALIQVRNSNLRRLYPISFPYVGLVADGPGQCLPCLLCFGRHYLLL
jgi:hypothetical protein